MRVLFDFQIFINQSVGGISRYFMDLQAGFRTMPGMECEIAAALSNNPNLDNRIRLSESFPMRRRLGRMINRTHIKHMLLKKVDVIHPTYYDIWYLNRSKKPVVITVHDLIYFKYPQYFADFRKFEENFSFALKRCDGIICISHNTKRELQERFNTGSKPVTVIHHGIGLAPPHRMQAATGKYFLYVGSRGLYKKFDVLLKAFKRLLSQFPDYKLVIVGGEHPSEAELRAFAQRPDNFKTIAFATDQQLADLYRNAVALVVTSLEEGFCYPVVEALLAGTRVICTDIDVLREVAGDYATYFTPSDEQSLYEQMLQIVSNPKGDLNKPSESIHNYYSIERMCNDTRDFYNTFE